MKYLDDSIMLAMLEKVQPLQIEILKTGQSAHLDGGPHSQWPDRTASYISFELTVFEENEIIKSFEFSAMETEEVLDATYGLAVAYTKYLKAHV